MNTVVTDDMFALAADCLGEAFVSPAQVSGLLDMAYGHDKLVCMQAALTPEMLARVAAERKILFAMPNNQLSLVRVVHLGCPGRALRYDSPTYVPSEKTTDTHWMILPREFSKDTVCRTLAEQQAMHDGLFLPTAADVAYARVLFQLLCNKRLYADKYLRTRTQFQSRYETDVHISVGIDNLSEVSLLSQWDGQRLSNLGAVFAEYL